MTNLVKERERALNAINSKFSQMDDETLDNWARKIIGLPNRPDNDKPFIGWLLPQNTPSKSEKALGYKITSQTGIELIKRWEGWRSDAYLCPANKWTIGYGHTRTAKRGMRITREQG